MVNTVELTYSKTCKVLLSLFLSRIRFRFPHRKHPPNAHSSLRFLGYRVNIETGVPEDRPMTTGLHTVRDVMCAKCGEVLGWKYGKNFSPPPLRSSANSYLCRRRQIKLMNLVRSIKKVNLYSRKQ
jgi:hypothetical protein